ncbi:MAG: hypothetical protein HY702_05635 [Gemmatimonadetes bacterium]|nr:hypothetical protein [Gemmatimonadota bacterium]
MGLLSWLLIVVVVAAGSILGFRDRRGADPALVLCAALAGALLGGL